MKVLLFGATGMIGQGVLRACLQAADVEEVRSVVRAPSGVAHPKLREFVHGDFLDFASLEDAFTGLDACFYCLGVSAAGLAEADYDRVTRSFTLAAAEPLARLNPGMTFVYVSGQGTDASERGRVMWARIKGRTENALLALPLRACMFRPGAIEPSHGEVSKTRLYRVLIRLLRPIFPLWRRLAPGSITSTEQIGRAMLAVARAGAPKPVLETADLNRL